MDTHPWFEYKTRPLFRSHLYNGNSKKNNSFKMEWLQLTNLASCTKSYANSSPEKVGLLNNWTGNFRILLVVPANKKKQKKVLLIQFLRKLKNYPHKT